MEHRGPPGSPSGSDHPFFGAQVKYLIQSGHGLLGAVGFAASALKIKDRDQYLGWNQEQLSMAT